MDELLKYFTGQKNVKLKDKLTRAPILAYPRCRGNFILDTDCSGFGMGALLSEIQDGEKKVIAYAS